MCVEGGIFFKVNKRASTFIREMRVDGIRNGVLFHVCKEFF